MTVVTDRQQLAYIAAQAADARVNVELETEGMTLNIGPQHPATHGTLRIVARSTASRSSAAEPVMGYMHRGYEKLTEVRTYPQVTTLINRIDWLGSFANEVPFILAAEKLMEHRGAAPGPVDPHHPVRAVPHRQHRRCSSATWPCSSARVTPVFYAFRDREYVLNQIEAATGGRFHPNFDRIGGLKDDLPKGWIDETKAVMEQDAATSATRWKTLVDRQRDLPGPHPRHRRHPGRRRASSTACRAPTCAASGVDWDLRRDQPLPHGLGQGRLEGLDPPRRRLVRPLLGAPAGDPRGDARSSTSCSTACPAGPIMAKVPRIIKVPEGEAWVADREPARRDGLLRRVARATSARSGSRSARPASTTSRSRRGCCEGVYVPDVITILASPVLHPRGHRPMIAGRSAIEPRLLAAVAPARRSACSSRCCCPPARSSTSSCSRWSASCRAASAPWRPGRTARCSCSPRSASSSRRRTSSPTRADRGSSAGALRRGADGASWSTSPCRSGPTPSFADLDVGVFYVAGRVVDLGPRHPDGRLGSANKYSLIGGLRAAGQLIAYELPMVLAVVGVVIQAGT